MKDVKVQAGIEPRGSKAAVLAALAVSAGLILLAAATYLVASTPAEAQGQTARVTLRIEGMTCASCGVAVRTALRGLDGVRSVEVSFEQKKASVTYEPRRVTPEQMVRAVERLGYRARVVTRR